MLSDRSADARWPNVTSDKLSGRPSVKSRQEECRNCEGPNVNGPGLESYLLGTVICLSAHAPVRGDEVIILRGMQSTLAAPQA